MTRIILVAAALLAFAPAANASILGSYLTYDGPVHHTLFPPVVGIPFTGGGEDRIIDESLAAIIDNDGSGLGATAGDYVVGMISVSDIDSSGVPNANVGGSNQLALVFALELAASGSAIYEFDAVPIADSTDAFDLRMLLPTIFGTGTSGLDDDSIAVIVGNGAGESGANPSPLNFPHTTVAGDIAMLDNTGGWSWELTAGIIPANGDFYQVDLLGVGGDFAREVAGFSRQAAVADLSGSLFSVDVQDFTGAVSTHDGTLSTGNIRVQPNGAFGFTDNSEFVVNPAPIPEPASIAVWAILATIIATSAAVHRRQTVN